MKILKNILLSGAIASSLLNAGGDMAPLQIPRIVAEPENSWSYEFQMYALAPWMKGDASLGYHRLLLPGDNSAEDITVDMSPKTIVDHLKMGFMGHFEAHQKQGVGVWLDYSFMNLGKDIKSSAEMGMFQGILEMFGTYHVPLEQGYIDYFAGVRWWHVEMDLTIENRDRKRSFDWYDPIIGLVWVTPIAENWSLRTRADVGGFGIASDFTAAVEVGTLYDINENWQVDIHFKSLWVDYEEGSVGSYDRFVYKTVTYGPVVGISYKF